MLKVPSSWQAALAAATEAPWFQELSEFVTRQRRNAEVYPPKGLEFAALEATPPEAVRAVLLGQDPYHGPGQAHGLAFSVPPDVPPPPSLKNIFRELQDDLGRPPPEDGCLERWARQGVLLLNTVLTVRRGEPHSHRGCGWEALTDSVIGHLAGRSEPIVFLLWGRPAQKKAAGVGRPHTVLKAAHPSPLSARRGFFGSRPFSQADAALQAAGRGQVQW